MFNYEFDTKTKVCFLNELFHDLPSQNIGIILLNGVWRPR